MPHRTQSNTRYSLEGLEAVIHDARENPHFLDEIWGIFCRQYPKQAGALNVFATQETAGSSDHNAKFQIILGTMVLFATLEKSEQAERLNALLFPKEEGVEPSTLGDQAPLPQTSNTDTVLPERYESPSDGADGDA